jgi:hypothetical protein
MSYDLRRDVDTALFNVQMVIEASASRHLREMAKRFLTVYVRIPEHILHDSNFCLMQAGGKVEYRFVNGKFRSSLLELNLRQQLYFLDISSPWWGAKRFALDPTTTSYLDLSQRDAWALNALRVKRLKVD